MANTVLAMVEAWQLIVNGFRIIPQETQSANVRWDASFAKNDNSDEPEDESCLDETALVDKYYFKNCLLKKFIVYGKIIIYFLAFIAIQPLRVTSFFQNQSTWI